LKYENNHYYSHHIGITTLLEVDTNHRGFSLSGYSRTNSQEMGEGTKCSAGV
jgi:hypothetical protein